MFTRGYPLNHPALSALNQTYLETIRLGLYLRKTRWDAQRGRLVNQRKTKQDKRLEEAANQQ